MQDMKHRDGLSQVYLPLLVVLLAIIGGLFGCASTGSGSTIKSDLITDSDEPENRKRARIRLELATGYYSSGQTTIALDELKQSISADPTLFDAYNLRGLIYMRLNNVVLAEESFQRALAINQQAASVQHNFGLLLCQQSRLTEALKMFEAALVNPTYGERAKTWMAQAGCQLSNGLRSDAETSFLKSYELDAGNPITGYNLALLLFQRGEYVRSQFYVRRINNSELANSESLWLGIKVERKLVNQEAAEQLGSQLKKRFPKAREALSFSRGAFDE
jgi:type IV pilus assembly protein PilF